MTFYVRLEDISRQLREAYHQLPNDSDEDFSLRKDVRIAADLIDKAADLIGRNLGGQNDD